MSRRMDIQQLIVSMLSIVALWLWPLVAAGQEGLDIVRRSIEHHGGETYEHSRIEMELCSGSGCYELSVLTDGGLYRHLVAGPVQAGRRQVEATNDMVRHWQNGAEVEVPATDEQRLRDWATARIYFTLLPYRLNDPSARQQDLGLERWGERDLRKVKVTFRADSSSDAEDEFLYWFDPDTARLEQFAYSFQGSPGGLRFRPLSNHRRVGGILFYDQENLGVEGDGLSIDLVDPQYVEQVMRPISTVRLQGIEVSALP